MGDDDELDEEGTGRDVLGEMEIAARIMITGGDEREDARMTRADRNAIVMAAKTVKEAGEDQVLTQDRVWCSLTTSKHCSAMFHRLCHLHSL